MSRNELPNRTTGARRQTSPRRPLSNELGTDKTVKAGFWPLLAPFSVLNSFKAFENSPARLQENLVQRVKIHDPQEQHRTILLRPLSSHHSKVLLHPTRDILFFFVALEPRVE